MAFVLTVIDTLLHLDTHLRVLATDYGPLVYTVLFTVVFCETGLVVTPFLPGDSILFMTGTLAAANVVGLWPSLAILMLAGIIGDTVNYHIGALIGPRAFRKDEARFFKKENLVAAQAFYDKWGGAAIILGRFVPVIRTFVPFAAGIGTMRYRRFITFNVIGAVLWVATFTFGGFLFGNVPFVQKNLTPIMYGIVLVSVIPALVGMVRARIAKRRKDAVVEG
jgi:membrane-associated protein